jgi:hypothetical protein
MDLITAKIESLADQIKNIDWSKTDYNFNLVSKIEDK